MLLGGGPGEKVLDGLRTVENPQDLSGVRDRDLILLDQRGVGSSRPALECPLFATTVLMAWPSAVAQCRERLRRDTDLNRYTTKQNAKDLDFVRRARGYREVNLLSNSYGTQLALEAMRGSPGWIRGALLSSPAPPQSNFVADAGPSYQRALDALLDACLADASCNAARPNLGSDSTR